MTSQHRSSAVYIFQYKTNDTPTPRFTKEHTRDLCWRSMAEVKEIWYIYIFFLLKHIYTGLLISHILFYTRPCHRIKTYVKHEQTTNNRQYTKSTWEYQIFNHFQWDNIHPLETVLKHCDIVVVKYGYRYKTLWVQLKLIGHMHIDSLYVG